MYSAAALVFAKAFSPAAIARVSGFAVHGHIAMTVLSPNNSCPKYEELMNNTEESLINTCNQINVSRWVFP